MNTTLNMSQFVQRSIYFMTVRLKNRIIRTGNVEKPGIYTSFYLYDTNEHFMYVERVLPLPKMSLMSCINPTKIQYSKDGGSITQKEDGFQ